MTIALNIDTPGGSDFEGYELRNVGKLSVGQSALPDAGYESQIAGDQKITGNQDVLGTQTVAILNAAALHASLTEIIQDLVGAMVLTTASVTATYNDGTGQISFAVITEAIQDIIGALITSDTTITVTYNDVANTFVIGVNTIPFAKINNPSVVLSGIQALGALGAEGTVLQVVGGALAFAGGAAFVGARYTTDAAQVIASSAIPSIINFEDITLDPQTDVTIGAAWKYTPSIPGKYEVFAQLGTDTYVWGSGVQCALYLYKNGVFYATLDNDEDAAPGFAFHKVISGSDIITMNGTTDYIDVRMAQSQGFPVSLLPDGSINKIVVRYVGA